VGLNDGVQAGNCTSHHGRLLTGYGSQKKADGAKDEGNQANSHIRSVLRRRQNGSYENEQGAQE
jgi:hypothetical protein